MDAATQSAHSLRAQLAAAEGQAAAALAAAAAAAQEGASEHGRALGVGAELAVARAALAKLWTDLAQAKVTQKRRGVKTRETQKRRFLVCGGAHYSLRF